MKSWASYATNPMRELHEKSLRTGMTYAEILAPTLGLLGFAPRIPKPLTTRTANGYAAPKVSCEFTELNEVLTYFGG
jgi:hypothetical protein